MKIKPINKEDLKIIKRSKREEAIIDIIRDFIDSDMDCCEIFDWETENRKSLDSFTATVRSVVSHSKLPIKVTRNGMRIFLFRK